MKKNRGRRFPLSFLLLLIIAAGVIVYVRLMFSEEKEKPTPDEIAEAAKNCLLASGSIPSGSDSEFMPEYSLAVIDQDENIYRVDSKVITHIIHLKKRAVIPYSVVFKYRGNGRGRLISYRYDLSKVKENSSAGPNNGLEFNPAVITKQIEQLDKVLEEK